MSYFAKVVPTSEASKFLVTDVISADQSFVDTQPGLWIQTSYNTYGNVHYAPSPPAEPHTPDGGTPLRANYAGIGYTYDEGRDAFIAPKCHDEAILDEATCRWTCSNAEHMEITND